MLGSSSGGGGGTVLVWDGAGVGWVALAMTPLAEGLVTFEAGGWRSSTASTTPTAPTASATAVPDAAIATRVALPTSVTVPTPLKRVQKLGRLVHHC